MALLQNGLVVLAVVATITASSSACGVFGADEPDEPAPAVDAGVEASPEGAAACQPVSPDDFVGCKCEPGSIRDCTHGKVGGNSRCVKGNQRCENELWSSCVGATDPVKEVCFDDIDNDCDGVLDNGSNCLGAPDYEVCGGVDPALPHVVTDKATYAPGETVQFLVFWKMPITTVHLNRSDGTFCSGASGGGAPASAGKGCESQGWYAYRRSLPIADPLFNAQATNVQMMVNPAAGPPCITPAVTVDIKVTKQ